MKIALVTKYYPPAVGAAALRMRSFAKYLAKKDLEIHVITEFPNYPSGVIPIQYKGKFKLTEQDSNIIVHRLYCFSSPKKNIFIRFLNEISFFFSSLCYLLKQNEFDVLIYTSPPFILAVSLIIQKFFHPKQKIILDIRDLYPQTAIELGYLKNKILIKIARFVEKKLYQTASAITTVSNGLIESINRTSNEPEKVFTLSNGADIDIFHANPDKKETRKKLNWDPEKFIIIYTGTHGLMENLETVIHAAGQLKGIPEIEFIFVGDGYCRNHLIQLAEKEELHNVIFLDNSYFSLIPDMLSAADIGLVLKKKLKLCQYHLPVKMFEYAACNLPIIASIEGEAVRLIEEYHLGEPVPAEDSKALADKIYYFYQNPVKLEQYAKNSRNTIIENFSREKIAEKLFKIIQKVI